MAKPFVGVMSTHGENTKNLYLNYSVPDPNGSPEYGWGAYYHPHGAARSSRPRRASARRGTTSHSGSSLRVRIQSRGSDVMRARVSKSPGTTMISGRGTGGAGDDRRNDPETQAV